MSQTPLSLFDRLHLLWKFTRLIAHLFTGALLAFIFLRKGIHNQPRASALFTWWNRSLCSIFNAHIKINGQPNHEATLFVMNHISWFDIPVLASQMPLHFLSKAEVAEWPVIGWLSRKTGTLFIQRGASGAAQKSMLEIVECLQKGGSVVVFPEGTTTDGSYIRNFHGRLLQAAIDAKVKIQPIALRYPTGAGINTLVPYIDDMTFADSVFGLMKSKPLDVELDFLTPIDAHIAEGDPENGEQASRKQLAALSRHYICKHLGYDE